MHYVIIGAGPTGVLAAEHLRKLDEQSDITIIGDEPEPPYSRMAIPYHLIGNIEEKGTYLRKEDGHYDKLNITVRRALMTKLDKTDHSYIRCLKPNQALQPGKWDAEFMKRQVRTCLPCTCTYRH